MSSWLVIAAVGALVAAVGAVLLFRHWRNADDGVAYVSVPRAREPIDPLLHSQLAASLSEAPSKPGNPLEGLRNWAAGTSDMAGEFEDFRRQMRTLQTYVLSLDDRYIRREEAAWVSLQVAAMVLGIATGVSTTVWALIELAK